VANQVKSFPRRWFIPANDNPPTGLQEDTFFRIQMFFHHPARWPASGVVVCLFFWSSLISGLWELALPGMGLVPGLVVLVFGLSDWLLLSWLPRAGRSYGPVNPQLMVMIIPRLLVAIGAAGLARFGQPAWGLAALFGLEVAGSLAYFWGLAIEPQRVSLARLTVRSLHLPAAAEPVRLLHLSDFHIERLTRREDRVLQLVADTKPDLIVLTGDYLNASYRRDPEAIDQFRLLLSRLKAPYGIYAVLGTPCVDLPAIAPVHFKGNGVHLLRRDVLEVDLGQGRKLALMGMDCTHDVKHDARMFEHAARLAPDTVTRVLLYHSPDLMPIARRHDLELYLCGHTHGGQVRLPYFGALFTSTATGKRYEMGRYDENGTTLYVSRGIGLEGFSMPRLRLLCPPEVTLVTLEGVG
jgi:uncharacterized protein